MEYGVLAVYQGFKTQCDNCNRKFTPGEVISESREGLVFCYSDGQGGCVIGYTMSTGKMMVGEPVRFTTQILPPGERTPNYPEIPMLEPVKSTSRSKPTRSLWSRIGKHFF